jgi:hypothetical protein
MIQVTVNPTMTAVKRLSVTAVMIFRNRSPETA